MSHKNRKNAFTISNQKAEWPKNHPNFWLQMRVGILSHLLPLFNFKRNGNIQFFFKNHYGNKADPLIFDGNSSEYLSQLYPFIKNIDSIENIIDLGCGEGALYHFLKKMKIGFSKYIGIDFAIPKTLLGSDATIQEADFTNKETVHFLTSKSILIAVNTFCYINKITEIPIIRSSNEKNADQLLVLEPWPGWFWDRHFDGIWPNYRSPQELSRNLSEIGWEPINQINFYYFCLFGVYVMPLSYAMAFKKRGK